MNLKKYVAAGLLIVCCVIFAQGTGYANGNGRRGGSRHSIHHRSFKYYRYYPRDFFFRKKIYYSPFKRHYYYYDCYPNKTYYYDTEKNLPYSNSNYLPITSIANMASQGIPDSVIISEIQRTRSTYKLNSEIITYLKQNGASDELIDYMMRTGSRY